MSLLRIEIKEIIKNSAKETMRNCALSRKRKLQKIALEKLHEMFYSKYAGNGNVSKRLLSSK